MNFDDPMVVMGMMAAGFALLILVGIPVMLGKFYHKVDQGQALINNTLKDVKVVFTGAFILPVIHRAELMDISLKTIEIDRRGKDGLICKDNIRADIKVTFFVRINKDPEDVLKVAQSVGCARASDPRTLEELFGAKFSEALKTVGKEFDFEDLYQDRENFRDRITRLIGEYLNGYRLEDAAIDYLEQTPMASLDPENILDSQGITKITKITAEQRIHTNELTNAAMMRVGKDDLDRTMAILEYDRQEADANAKQQREIQTVKAREQATAQEVVAQEHAKEELARLEAQQQIAIRAINKQREEEVAGKNRERVLAVETENVEKERSIQIIAREREVDLRRIAKDKEIEVERKAIAEVVRDRVAVDKTVAQEEENIKDLRELAEADRRKKVMIIAAEGKAEEQLVANIKAAQASEEVSKFQARERIVTADAELDAADRVAKAKIRTAEGTQAEIAAEGLALVRVREADAVALEKQGLVEAKILREKMQAEAAGREQQGMTEVRLKEAGAVAAEKTGLVEVRLKEADAEASEKLGMVDVRLKEAGAQAIEKEGMAHTHVLRDRADAEALVIEKRELAEATGIRERLIAEADGLEKKAVAMKALDDVSRDHEEFRLRLEQEKVLAVEHMRTNIEVARAQASVLGEAFKAANINIVGGDEAFFNRFTNAVSLGQTVDGFLANSPAAQQVLNRIVGPGENGATSGPINVAGAIKDLMSKADDTGRETLSLLLEQAKRLETKTRPAPGDDA